MTFREIFRFEIGYQSRRPATWLYFALLLILTVFVTSELSEDYARSDDSVANAPFFIAVMSLVFGTMGLLIARTLLADLFERNTFWELEARKVTAMQTAAGAWQVNLDVRARKVVVDESNVETELPMDDLIEVGVFAGADVRGLGETLYLQRHRVRSGAQRITITVPRQPTRAGIDPRRLLFDVEGEDHLREIGKL